MKENIKKKMMRGVGSTIGSWQQPNEGKIQTDSLTTTEEVAKAFNVKHSMEVQTLAANWKGEKSLISACLMSWSKNQKNRFLKCCLLLLYVTTTNHLSIGLWRLTKSGFYMTTGDDQLSGWTEKKLESISQSQLHTNKRSWALFDGRLLVWSATAFWILTKPLHLRSMLSKSMRCTENCNACSQH